MASASELNLPKNDTTISSDRSAESPNLSASDESAMKKDWRFWLIFLSVCVATLLVAIDLSIVSTALPTISEDLDAKELFVWVANAYVLASTAVQPLFGQAANIFGRRSLTIVSVLLFMLGSGIAGGATNINMLIAARTIQGIGGGGIITLGEIITCDLLPLRERGQYSGLISATYAIGTILGRKSCDSFNETKFYRCADLAKRSLVASSQTMRPGGGPSILTCQSVVSL